VRVLLQISPDFYSEINLKMVMGLIFGKVKGVLKIVPIFGATLFIYFTRLDS